MVLEIVLCFICLRCVRCFKVDSCVLECVIAGTCLDACPVSVCSCIINVFQAQAVLKCIVSDGSHAFWQIYVRKAAAPGKRGAFDLFYAFWNLNVFQALAAFECVCRNRRHAFWKLQGHQLAAFVKSIRPDSSDAVRKGHGFQAPASPEKIFPDFGHAFWQHDAF